MSVIREIDIMGKKKIIPISALIVLLIGSLSSAYVYTSTVDTEFITINGNEYTIDQLFFIGEEKTINSNSELFTGIALDSLIIKTGVVNPEDHDYKIIASDGYQKTVKWENIKNGVLTREGTSIFSDLPKAYRVKNIIHIEVI